MTQIINAEAGWKWKCPSKILSGEWWQSPRPSPRISANVQNFVVVLFFSSSQSIAQTRQHLSLKKEKNKI